MKLHYIIPFFMLVAFSLQAQIIHIPAEQPTIQAGIENALDGDTILVEEGTYYENINFLGKPVTVASQFILDGDTSHISRTVIDGSQPQNPDDGSVVSMLTGEDTTSVLMGFTITGGSGTYVANIHMLWPTIAYYGGGGILMYNSGGKIVHNIIEKNNISDPDNEVTGALGCGILAAVNHNHTVIIRNNLVQYNSGTADGAWGGGISLHGGRCIAENNIVQDNILDAIGFSCGPGMFFEDEYKPGTIEETVIRNNRIIRNIAISENGAGAGGGITIGRAYDNLLICNNLIVENQANYGGGFYGYLTPSLKAFNNTIVNNESQTSGNNICVDEGCNMILFNNIVWSDSINGVADIGYWDKGNSSLRLFHNILTKPCNPPYPVIREGNSYLNPELDDDTFEPGPSSPAVGRGIDTMWMDTVWYLAPVMDINGSSRPAETDPYVDIGAIETEFARSELSNANLASIGMLGHSLIPDFHKDTLNYFLQKDPGYKYMGYWRIYQADHLAAMEVDTAADLLSENEQDRTTKILVTAMDGTTQKEYTVVYNFLSSDATLSSIDVSQGTLEPAFDPSITDYFDTIPYGTRITPEVVCTPSDTLASVQISPANDVNVVYELFRTTNIYVTAPNNITLLLYKILFTVDKTRPEVTLNRDSVEIGEEIGVTVSEACQIYLVPENIPGIYDSITAYALKLSETGTNDTLFLSTGDLDTINYWIYACDRHQSVSEYKVLNIYQPEETTDITIDQDPSNNFRVYPTPTTGMVYFTVPLAVHNVALYNILGEQVLRTDGLDERIDVGHLPDGIYVLRIFTEQDRVFTARIIKK